MGGDRKEERGRSTKTKVIWVRLDHEQLRENGKWPLFIATRRVWWPVYWPSHVDPELGPLGQQPHYHIAWNRLTDRQQGWVERIACSNSRMYLARLGIAADIVVAQRQCRRGIVGPPIAPILPREFVLKTWKEMRTKIPNRRRSTVY